MLNILLLDTQTSRNLLPLTYSRPVGDLRIGILTIAEKWHKWLGSYPSFVTSEHLSQKFTQITAPDNLLIDGSLLPEASIVEAISTLPINTILTVNGIFMAARFDATSLSVYLDGKENFNKKDYGLNYQSISSIADIIRFQGSQITSDFELLTKNRISAKLSESNRVIGSAEKIFLEPGAKAECAIFNTEAGPVYIGNDSEIMEGSIIRGPFGMGEHSIVKMAAKIYPNVSLGPHCKLGGEAGNSILYGYSNKGHDGYLGDSYIGEWCNLGADTNTSNLKNNYAEVKLWNYSTGRFVLTGLQFCGLIMGDHSKSGINTMFNTGTVVGMSCNIFGDGYPRNFIPSFSWGGASGLSSFAIEKAIEASNAMMARRGLSLTEIDKNIFQYVWGADKEWRK
ncbi:MAG: glucose-1-phosphate thymidylyltransferase [Saprospiraceae bacterium]|jgi:UDP-N-acetylglucosamine diphosphorylase/glucosamine-1-phosphate N-acetyltransferase|nr:glucose-1-phosphate thymidylyltransferase [Saprospiraceae bacterium]